MKNRKQVEVMYHKLVDRGIPHQVLLEWIINNYLDGSQASEALELFEMEFFDEVFNDYGEED